MSYILDALRRADAERERGAVPSLHTQQYGNLPGDDDAPDRPLLLIGVIVFLVLALGAALAWHFSGSSSDTTTRLATQGVVPALPLPLTPAPDLSAPTLPILAPPMATAAPSAAAAPASAALDSKGRPENRRATAAASAVERKRAARAAPAPASAPASAVDAGQLPDSMRRELPALAFGGASYSKDPASRMVIFNGRVFHEGDTIAPQLVLQQIKLKAAVLGYKGYHYEVGY
jgi:general secretion pathway protein B